MQAPKAFQNKLHMTRLCEALLFILRRTTPHSDKTPYIRVMEQARAHNLEGVLSIDQLLAPIFGSLLNLWGESSVRSILMDVLFSNASFDEQLLGILLPAIENWRFQEGYRNVDALKRKLIQSMLTELSTTLAHRKYEASLTPSDSSATSSVRFTHSFLRVIYLSSRH